VPYTKRWVVRTEAVDGDTQCRRIEVADGEEGPVGRERADRLGDVVGAAARRPGSADGACASFRV
jgi:hypothetical protein